MLTDLQEESRKVQAMESEGHMCSQGTCYPGAHPSSSYSLVFQLCLPKWGFLPDQPFASQWEPLWAKYGV
jgi:membrane-associated PAP2 superfamily phosphatase